MNTWVEKELGDILKLNYGRSLPEKHRIQGDVPVYGSNGIVGYHDQPFVTSPGLIVGRKGSAGNVHYSRTPFCAIDTTFFIAPSDTIFDLDFLYFLLLHVDLKRILGDVGVPGLNREMAYKEKTRFPTKKDEQRKIAATLGLVETAIEQQDRLIALTRELKSALMNKLFTEGLHGEKQKMTEIGPVPESWELVKIGDIFKFSSGKTRPADIEESATIEKPFPVYGGNGVMGYADRYLLKEPTLILGRVGEYCGVAHHTRGKAWVSDNALYTREIQREVNTNYMSEYFTFANLNQYSNKAGQPLITQGSIAKVLMPLPKLNEQNKIYHHFDVLNKKSYLLESKKTKLNELFRTLLHQLMTGQIRVNDIDLPGLS